MLLAESLDLAALGGGAAAGGLEQAGPEVRVGGLAGARRLLRRAHPHAAALVHQRRLARVPRCRRALRYERRREPLVPCLQRLVEEGLLLYGRWLLVRVWMWVSMFGWSLGGGGGGRWLKWGKGGGGAGSRAYLPADGAFPVFCDFLDLVPIAFGNECS